MKRSFERAFLFGDEPMKAVKAMFIFPNLKAATVKKILVECINGIYPAQATVYATELIEKGSYDDLDTGVMESLREMGWAE